MYGKSVRLLSSASDAVHRREDLPIGTVTHSELLLSPEGRITRAQWWYGTFMLNGSIALSWWLERVCFAATPVFHVLLPIVFMLLAYPSYCLHSKRFQDRDRHYAYAGAFVVVQLAGIILMVSGHRRFEMAGFLMLAGLGFWSVVELGLLKGTDGANRFGHVPA
jgi:uncharacterized membrane protein YhaH (DUF805 family)